MNGAFRTISVALTANPSGYVAGIRTAIGATNQFDRAVEKSTAQSASRWETFASKAGKAVKLFAVGAGVALAAFVAGSVAVATSFEKQVSGIAAVSGASAAELDALRQKALQLGEDTSFSAREAASGMEELVKAGVPVSGVLNGAADAATALAAAGGVELAEAAKISANALNQFQLSAQQLPHVADMIAGAANASSIDVHDFGLSLQQAGAVASLAGLSFDDTAVAITAMGQAGIRGSDAGTSLKTFLINLSPTTERAATAMRELGIITEDGANKFYDAQGNVKSLAEIAGVLETALAGLTAEQQQQALVTLFGSDALRAAAIVAREGAGGIRELNTEMGKISANEVAEKRLDNLAGSIEKFRGSIETLMIKTGSAFTGFLREVVDLATEAVNFLAAPPEGFTRFFEEVGRRALPILESLRDAGVAVGDVLATAADHAQPFVETLAKLGAGIVYAGILGIAEALEHVAEFLAENEGLVRTLTTALIALAAVKAFNTLLTGVDMFKAHLSNLAEFLERDALGRSIAGTGSRFTLFASGMRDVVTQGANMRTGFGKMRESLSGLGSALASPQVAIAGFTVALFTLQQAFSNAESQANQMVEGITKGIDRFDPGDMASKLGEINRQLEEQMVEWHEFDGVGGIIQGTVEALSPLENKVLDNAAAVKRLREEQDRLETDITRLRHTAEGVSGTLGIPFETVLDWMRKLELDPATTSFENIQEAVFKASNAAKNATPQTQALAESYGTLADETASATDKLDAYKSAIDAIFGITKSVFDAQTAYGQSINDLTDSLTANGRTLDQYTAQGQANREALSGMTDSAIEFAQAIAQRDGIDAGTASLSLFRQQIVDIATDILGSKSAAEEFVNSIGLTTGGLAELAAGTADPKGGLQDINAELDKLDGTEAVATAKVDTTQADPKLEGLFARFKAYVEADPEAKARLDDKDPIQDLNLLATEMEEYAKTNPEARAFLDSLNAEQKFRFLNQWLENWDSSTGSASVRADAETYAAEQELRHLTRDRSVRIFANYSGSGAALAAQRRAMEGRWGAITAYATGGITPAHITRTQVFKYGEPETGGEAFVPRFGHKPRSMAILAEAAGWYGADVVPRQRVTGFATGGVMRPAWVPTPTTNRGTGSPPPIYVTNVIELDGTRIRHIAKTEVDAFGHRVAVEARKR